MGRGAGQIRKEKIETDTAYVSQSDKHCFARLRQLGKLHKKHTRILTSSRVKSMNRAQTMIAAITLIVVALIIAGCGSGDSSTPSAPTPTAPTTQQPQEAPTQAPTQTDNSGNGPGTSSYNNSCSPGVCPDAQALKGWKAAPKPTGSSKFNVNLRSYVQPISPSCQFTFTISPPMANPPAPDQLAATITPKAPGKKSPPPPQFSKRSGSVYVQPLIDFNLPTSPISQTGALYTNKSATPYAVLGTITLSTPVGSPAGACSPADVSKAKNQITGDLVQYLSGITL